MNTTKATNPSKIYLHCEKCQHGSLFSVGIKDGKMIIWCENCDTLLVRFDAPEKVLKASHEAVCEICKKPYGKNGYH